MAGAFACRLIEGTAHRFGRKCGSSLRSFSSRAPTATATATAMDSGYAKGKSGCLQFLVDPTVHAEGGPAPDSGLSRLLERSWREKNEDELKSPLTGIRAFE